MDGRPPELDPIYTNNVAFHPGSLDLTFDAGFQLPGGAGEPQWAVRLVMTWSHAKSFAKLLQDSIDAYEEEIGPIDAPAPPEHQEEQR